MRSGVLVWSAVTALLGVLLVEGAPADPVTDDCTDGDVRPFIVRSESETFSAALGGVLGDVWGSFEICEDQFWKKVVLCVSDGGQQWTVENTAVACRELGYPAAASSGAATDQIVESSRRLTYMPQCEGGEERLRDCPTVDQDDSCDAPLVISCWNSSPVSSQPSPTLTLTTHTSTTTATHPLSPATSPAFSSLQLPSSKSTHNSSSSTISLKLFLASSTLSVPTGCARERGGESWQLLVYSGLAGVAVGAVTTATLSLSIFLIHGNRNRKSSFRDEVGHEAIERNPAYQTRASLIPSSSNTAYAGIHTLSPQSTAHVYEDVV